MALILEHKTNNPHDSYQKVTDLYGVSKSLFYECHTSIHVSYMVSAAWHLSIMQEEELVKKINEYAEQGTLLILKYVIKLQKWSTVEN